MSLNFLFAAYTVTWVLIFAYFLRLSARQKHLLREIEAMQQLLDERKDAV